jgi:hypothetical protein
MSTACIILQYTLRFLQNQPAVYFKEILLTNFEGFKIFKIRSKLYKNPL